MLLYSSYRQPLMHICLSQCGLFTVQLHNRMCSSLVMIGLFLLCIKYRRRFHSVYKVCNTVTLLFEDKYKHITWHVDKKTILLQAIQAQTSSMSLLHQPSASEPHSSSFVRESQGERSGSGLFVPKQIPQIPEWDVKGEAYFPLFPVSLLRQVKMVSCFFNLCSCSHSSLHSASRPLDSYSAKSLQLKEIHNLI